MKRNTLSSLFTFVLALGAAGVVLLNCPVPLRAQLSTATLSGTITDPSGSIVPDVQVTLDSTLQKYTRQTASSLQGLYAIPAIPPGTYVVVMKAAGFRAEKIGSFQLSSGQATTLNVSLAIVTATEEVTVTAAPPLLQTTTATLGSVVDSKRITELPLASRNALNVLLTLPGVSPVLAPDGGSFGVKGGVNPSVYGQRQRDNNYTLDGVAINVPIHDGPGFSPPPEALAEVKVESGMSSGAYGRASGANINSVTKSGTKELHGDLWEYFRNDLVQARSFFTPTLGKYHWNQFGAAVGGPLVIPGLVSKKDGWYFFGYYEGIRVRTTANASAMVATPAQLQGDFSANVPIFNPYTTNTNASGVSTRQPFPDNQIPASMLNGSALLLAKTLYPAPNLAPGVIAGANYLNTGTNRVGGNEWGARFDHQFGKSDSFAGRYTAVYNPQRSISLPLLATTRNENFFNIALSDTHIFSPTFLVTARFGLLRMFDRNLIPANPPELAQNAGTLSVFPAFLGNNFLPGINIANYRGLGNNLGLNDQYLIPWTVDAHKSKGRHSIEFGGGMTRSWFLTTNNGGNSVTFNTLATSGLTTASTGDGMASFLLGLPATAARQIGDPAGDLIGDSYSLYLQDTFRVTKRLTLNLGFRWEFASPMTNKIGSGTFTWETGKYNWDRTNPITGEPANMRRGSIPPAYHNFQPRLGIAYQVSDKMVVRTSYGIFFDTFGGSGQTQQGNRGNWPFAFPQNLSGVNVTVPNAFFPNPFPTPAASSTPLGCLQCLNVWKDSSRTPYVQQWTFSVQRQITPSLMAEAAYFGSHGIRLLGQIVDNTALTPGPGPVAARQRWSHWTPVYTVNGVNIFPSYYHALTLKLERRLSRNLLFQANYSWSKNIDVKDSLANLASSPGPTRLNMGGFKGLAGFDIQHRFVVSYVYELPVQTSSRLANALLAHWNLSGVASFDNGLVYAPVLSTDRANIGTTAGQVPLLIGNPNAITARTPQKWFNTAAFVSPPLYTFGNTGRNILRGDGLSNWDFSLYKRWVAGETKWIELRGETFNLLNKTTFGLPALQVESILFGQVTGTRTSGRLVQFALKVHF